jgi:hypothetical protein
MTGLEAVNEAARVIGLELVRRKSDLATAPLKLSYRANRNSAALPDDFMGFVEHPELGGEPMERMPDDELNTTVGTPRWYRQVADTLYIYPVPLVAVSVTGRYKTVSPVLEMSDDTPWLGMFDNLLLEAAARLSVSGHGLIADAGFVTMVDQGVSAVLIPRQNPLPRRRPAQFF